MYWCKPGRMADTLADARGFRTLNIVDDFSHECPAIEVDRSLPGARVVRVLERLAETIGLPLQDAPTGAGVGVGRYHDVVEIALDIVNNTDTEIDGWTLTYAYSGNQKLGNGWNGTWSQSGQNITVNAREGTA